MKMFLKTLLIFSIPLVLLIIVGLLLPPTPRATTSHLFAKHKMDSLLHNVPSPRLILVGGSNISLSINSQIFRDSLGINPINTGLSINIGLCYMLDNTVKHVRKNDVVIVSPEYDQFFNRVSLGGEDLVRTVFDVSRKSLLDLRPSQAMNIAPLIPYYALTKFKIREYTSQRDPSEIYDRDAFNEYGDNAKHWALHGRSIAPLKPLNAKSFDHFVIDALLDFETILNRKGAKLFITFPALQEESYLSQKEGIKKVEKELIKAGFLLIGRPERYLVPDSLLFDSPYHLIKPGVDQRTWLLARDLQRSLSIPDSNRQHALHPSPIIKRMKE